MSNVHLYHLWEKSRSCDSSVFCPLRSRLKMYRMLSADDNELVSQHFGSPII